jgi:GAF domain-containing protein
MSEATEQALLAARAAQDDLRERLMTLAAAAGTLLISPSVEDVLPATLTLATQMVEADGYAVWRLQDGFWRVGASRGISEHFANTIVSLYQRVSPADTIPFIAPLFAEDVDQVPMLEGRREAFQTEGVKSVLAVPLLIRGQPSGALSFYFRRPHQFTEVETQIVLALGNLASAAITTAEMYDAQRRIRSQSDFLAEAAAVLASRSTITTLKWPSSPFPTSPTGAASIWWRRAAPSSAWRWRTSIRQRSKWPGGSWRPS